MIYEISDLPLAKGRRFLPGLWRRPRSALVFRRPTIVPTRKGRAEPENRLITPGKVCAPSKSGPPIREARSRSQPSSQNREPLHPQDPVHLGGNNSLAPRPASPRPQIPNFFRAAPHDRCTRLAIFFRFLRPPLRRKSPRIETLARFHETRIFPGHRFANRSPISSPPTTLGYNVGSPTSSTPRSRQLRPVILSAESAAAQEAAQNAKNGRRTRRGDGHRV